MSNEDSRSLLLATPTPDGRERERQREVSSSNSTSRRFRTLLYLLASDKSDADDGVGDDPTLSRWRAFKERLGFTLLGCCSGGSVPSSRRRRSSSAPPSPSLPLAEENQADEIGVVVIDLQETQDSSAAPGGGGMNLAEALAAEREFRVAAESPERVSLMRLLEAAEREREAEEAAAEEEEVGNDDYSLCCVCMVRKKGAAIIPCGHTFCRVCAKDVWTNRGSCPLCNRHIVDVLKIF